MEKAKKIGIDCRMINESGIGRYIFNLILNLNQIDRVNNYVLFVLDSSEFPIKLENNFKIVESKIKWHSFEEQSEFLTIVSKHNLDLFHSPHPNMPYLYTGKFVITIHDLTMLKERTGRASTYFYPIYFIKWFAFKIMLSLAVRKSSKIITVSNFVKNEIIKTFKVSEDKVEVIYNGVPENVVHKTIEESKELLSRFEINKPFLFYVGNAYPHKNLENLILAFEQFNKEKKYTLVLGGKEDFFYKRLKEDFRNSENIVFTGGLSDDEISAFYSSCQAFIYPSISEGFGIQIVEAIKCEARIICSDNTSFPEIAGDYAFYFNPFKVSEISNALEEYLDSDYRSRLPEAKKRLKLFDWNTSARKHYELYQKI